MIPRIIHQTWKTKDIPKQAIPWVESWKRFHPKWEYRLWTDEDNLRLCCDSFPELLDVYNSYSFDIQRVDVIRYMILYKYGGFYSDIDTECFKSFEDVINNDCLIFKWLHIVTNYLLASSSGFEFFKFVLGNLIKPTIHFTGFNKRAFVLSTTGPVFLYNCYKEYFKEYKLFDNLQYVIHHSMGSWC